MNLVILCVDSGETLRYALRSIARCSGVDRLILVGNRPKWYKGEHIAHEARGINTHDQANKLLLAMDALQNEPFTYTHDDIIFHVPVDFDTLPLYRQNVTFTEKTQKYKGNRGYLKHLQSTYAYLQRGRLADLCFEGHTTTRVDNPALFRMCLAATLNHPIQLQFQSLYGCSVGDGIPIPNTKIAWDKSRDEVENMAKDRPYISTSDKGMQSGTGEFVKELFAKKCKFEL